MKRMRWAGHVARIDEKRNPYKILVWKPEGTTFEIPWPRWGR
jgi:hypothetical protein